MNQLNEYILKRALEATICEEWAAMIPNAPDRDALLKMYVKGIDFCLTNNFPSNADLVKLGGDSLAVHGIHVDVEVNKSNPEFLVLLGGCTAQIDIDGFTVSQIHLKQASTANITIGGNAFVIIDCFEATNIKVTASGNAKVLINLYSDAVATVEKAEAPSLKPSTNTKTLIDYG